MEQDRNPIPVEVERQYEGRWIAWDTVDEQVVADGETVEEVVTAAAEVAAQGHLIWYRHILPRDAVIVGGL